MENINLKSSFKNRAVSVVVADAEEYNKVTLKLMKYFANEKKIPGVYVTLNKPYSAIKTNFDSEKINSKLFIFIDGITASSTHVTEPKKDSNCLYIPNPENLTDLSIAISEAMNSLPSKEKFIFFDSITTLLIYNKPESVVKFTHFLAGRMREWNVNGLILSLTSDTKSDAFQKIVLFADNVINFSKKKGGV